VLRDELKRSEIDLDNLQYIYTSMNLLDPKNELLGKITGSFLKLKGCEPKHPNALYNIIKDLIEEKACYELSIKDYDELIRRKGVTKSELDMILEKHKDQADESVAQVKALIDQMEVPVREKKRLNIALNQIYELQMSSQELNRKENEISAYILKNESKDLLFAQNDVWMIADGLIDRFGNSFSLEYTKEQKLVFMLLIVKRWEGGKYEQTHI
jgi:hypothetical protein